MLDEDVILMSLGGPDGGDRQTDRQTEGGIMGTGLPVRSR